MEIKALFEKLVMACLKIYHIRRYYVKTHRHASQFNIGLIMMLAVTIIVQVNNLNHIIWIVDYLLSE